MALLSKLGVVGTLVVGAAVVFGTVGCGGSGDGFKSSGGGSDNVLVGTWTRSTLAVDGTSITCPNNLTVNNIVVDTCSSPETIQFTSDGHYTLNYPTSRYGHLYAEYGTYSQDGDSLTLTRTAIGEDTEGAGVIGSDEIHGITEQAVPNALSINSDHRSFSITPVAPGKGANYSVPQSLDGSTVTSTFTR